MSQDITELHEKRMMKWNRITVVSFTITAYATDNPQQVLSVTTYYDENTALAKSREMAAQENVTPVLVRMESVRQFTRNVLSF